MAEAPTGTITFLFTDVEGSTRLWQQHPQAMREALAQHDRIVRDAIETNDGYVFSTGGDSFATAFAGPIDAMRAALDAQHALSLADWGEVGALKVRMALDTGLAEHRDGDYFGPPLNRVARIEEQGAGGQILVSNTTADLIRFGLPGGFELTPLGERKLRDVERPVQLFQLQPEATAGPSRGLLVGGMVASGAVLAVVIIAAILLATRSPSVGQAEGETTQAPTGDASIEPVWSVELPGPAADVHVEHGAIHLASSAGGTSTLRALGASDGDERWVFETEGALRGGIHSDGRALYLLTSPAAGQNIGGDRLWIVDPANGNQVVGCGLVLATADSSVAVTPEAVFVLSATGPVYRVETDTDGSGRCHEHALENRFYALAPPMASGPVPAGSALMLGDSQRLYQLDASDLGSDAFYFPAEGRVTGYRGTPEAVDAAAVRIQTPTAIEETIPVYAVDGEGLLHSSPDGVVAMAPTELTVAWTPLVDTAGVILVVDGTLARYSHDLSTVRWEADVGTVRHAELGNGVVYLIDDDGVRVLDADSGDPLWALETGSALSATGDGSRVFVVMDNDRIDAYRIGDDADDVSVSEPIPPREVADPIDVVERYYTAYNSGDADAVLRLYATDAIADAEVGGVARSLMREVIQDEFTDLLSGAIAFEWQIEIRNCVIAEQTEFATSVRCDGIARNIADEILGVAADGVVRLWIDNGLVRRIEEDHDAKELLGLNRFGFFYVDTPEDRKSVV